MDVTVGKTGYQNAPVLIKLVYEERYRIDSSDTIELL